MGLESISESMSKLTQESGIYKYFATNYVDPIYIEFKFDIEKADVMCTICNTKYRPSVYRDKTLEDIQRFEIKSFKFPLVEEKSYDPLQYHVDIFGEDGLEREKTKKVKRMVDNGWSGAQHIGKVHLDKYDVMCKIKKTMVPYHKMVLLANDDAITWGGDSTIKQYPDRSTFQAGTIVYYLNIDNDPSKSPLMAYHHHGYGSGWNSHMGQFTVTHSLKGILNLFVPFDFEVPEGWLVNWDAPGCKDEIRIT